MEKNQNQAKLKKPVISYWRSSDPTNKLNVLKSKLTEINIIKTKNLSKDFNDFCIQNKDKIYLHIIVNGMGRSMFEPNILSVKEIFEGIKDLLDRGFQQNKILIVVDPIIPNMNGLKAIQLLLKLFTEYKYLRLRRIRFKVLSFYYDKGKYNISNRNITSRRPSMINHMMYLKHEGQRFYDCYNNLKEQYKTIIEIDDDNEALIGVRELITFGLNNSWRDENGNVTKLIEYEKNDKQKPIVNIISNKNEVRCSNRCVLCPYKG